MKSFITLLLLTMFFGCEGESFKSGGGAAWKAQTEIVKIPCGSDGKSKPVRFTGISGTKVTVEGELCSLTEQEISGGAVNILFVIDYSGSMSGADPETGGTCGRFKAAEAITDAMAKDAGDSENVKVGLVQFHRDAEQAIPMTSLKSFRKNLSADDFCGFQDAAGQLNTNYEAGFEEAESVLKKLSGAATVYFITDGAPTLPSENGGNDPDNFGDVDAPYDAGLAAAKSLRDSGDGIELNAIYLDNGSTAGLGDGTVPDPETYLGDVAGSKDRVRIVTDADDLAVQIVTFDKPTVTDIDPDKIFGELRADGYGSRDVVLDIIEIDEDSEGIWTFKTAPVELFGEPGSKVKNTLIFKSSQDGIPESRAEVIFDHI